jgi:NADPH:quinone reductase-like Zn-dependent oxidoreductase
MKAVRVHAYDGKPESICVEDVPVQRPGTGQVTIRVAAAPINPSDLMFLRGRYGLTKPTPAIPGFEGAGIVVSAGPDLYGRWLLGKRVACGTEPEGGGTWAQYVTTSTRLCMPLPPRVSDEEGAMVMANPVTAIALLHEAKERGHRAAVHTAAAGALGRILFRIASKAGFPIIHVVRREEQVRLLKELGDEIVLNATSPDFLEKLKEESQRLGATIAFDPIGGESTGQLVDALPTGSQIIVYGALSLDDARVDQKKLIFEGKQIEGFWFPEWAKKKGMLRLISCARKSIKGVGVDWTPEVAERVPLEQVREAMLRYENDMTRGKVLLVPSPSGSTALHGPPGRGSQGSAIRHSSTAPSVNHTGTPDGIKRAKAPWRLAGDAYVVTLKMPAEVLDRECFVPEILKGHRLGTSSRMIYVDYKDSPVGPYKELLFNPPKFRFGMRPCRTISKIFVSTPESVVNGQENWGIPKTLAEFECRTLENGWERIAVSVEGKIFAELTFSSVRFGMPYSDRWVPARFKTMAQTYQERSYFYTPITRTTMKMGRLRESKIDSSLFPDISKGKITLCVRLEDFRMWIPAATIVPQPKG